LAALDPRSALLEQLPRPGRIFMAHFRHK